MNPQALLELKQGFFDRIAELGQSFALENPSYPYEFEGILLPINPIDPQLELGSDWREMATLEGSRERVPWNVIKYGDVIIQLHPFWATDVLSEKPRWKVIRRNNNPANFTVQYWVVKITTEDA